MIVADTSAWVEFLRDTGRPAGRNLQGLLESGAEVAVTEIVVMELLSRVSSRPAVLKLRTQLLAFPMLPLQSFADFEDAALLYQACRRAGETLRGIIDCLIAVPAMKAGAELLHNDRDFDVIARHSPLKIYRPK